MRILRNFRILVCAMCVVQLINRRNIKDLSQMFFGLSDEMILSTRANRVS